MTSKEVLASFSEILLQDERILSSRERELLTNLLQVAKASSETASNCALTEVIAHAIGETIARRAFTVLGGQVIQQILPEAPKITAGPRPPSPAPGPGTNSGIRLTGGPRPPSPAPGPGMTTVASGPRPPKASISSNSAKAGQENSVAAVLEQPEVLPAECVVLDEFLVPEELSQLMAYALSHETDFVLSEVIAPADGASTVDYEHRRSRVLMEIGEQQKLIANRIQACLPGVLQKLGREPFPISQVEAQITASNDGDFFRHHNDNGQGEIASRELTFVYFFHREPKAFRGGELRIYDSRRENGEWFSTGNYRSILPQQNQIVFFPSNLLHEITPIECASKAFADSRFTVNGWFHR